MGAAKKKRTVTVEVSNERFDGKVREIARRSGVEVLLSIPGVWELVAEEFNNDALMEIEHELEEEAGPVSG